MRSSGKNAGTKKMRAVSAFVAAAAVALLWLCPALSQNVLTGSLSATSPSAVAASETDLPVYAGEPYIELNGNVPCFDEADLDSEKETYSPLDALGRCGAAFAVVSEETMPAAERGDIGMIKPSGWHTVRYDDLVDGKYLYNRCHLIGYQLTGQNANELNLITGTRYMNVEGMLPFENLIADFVAQTGRTVAYRVTPVFVGDELVARGVQMEAMSVEDRGAGLSFNVFCFNVQPGIEIDYSDGSSTRL